MISNPNRYAPASASLQTAILPQSCDPLAATPCFTKDNEAHRLLAEISARMVRATAEELDELTLLSLQQALQPMGADRGGLLHVDPNSPVVKLTHVWYGDGIPELSTENNMAELFPWTYEQVVVRGNCRVFRTIGDLPSEAVVDRQTYAATGVKSALCIPLYIGHRVHHLIAVQSLRSENHWTEEIITQLRLLGEIFVSALQRREADIFLQQTRDRLDLAAESADAGLWELDLGTGQFWATRKTRELFGYAEEASITLENFFHKVHSDDRPQIQTALKQLSEQNQGVDVEYRVTDSSGEIRWMHSRGRLLQNIDNQYRILAGVTIEVSRQKKLEQRLKENLQEIDQLRARLEQENSYLRSEVVHGENRQNILCSSPCMQAIMTQVEQVAGTGSTVLIQGETGTGKELIAQAVHNLSDRNKRVMVKVNCAALPAALVESELFGREKGAFTGALSRQAGRFELADGSTLFLDEIAEMPLETQAKLLRVLQEGEFERLGSPKTIKVDVRVIAASNRDLGKAVEEGRFRRDLYYRLNIFPIQVPPLRERADDIPQLVWEFVNEFGGRMGKKIRRIAAHDMERLKNYAWLGNVRELRNVIEHALIVSKGETLELNRLAMESPEEEAPKTLEDVERRHIQTVLKLTGGRVKGAGGAAERLGINPSTLYSRMQKLGISPRSA